jgi:hypothetical protein
MWRIIVAERVTVNTGIMARIDAINAEGILMDRTIVQIINADPMSVTLVVEQGKIHRVCAWALIEREGTRYVAPLIMGARELIEPDPRGDWILQRN